MTKFIVIKTTFPYTNEGKKLINSLSKTLLRENLAACIQITATESYYLWNKENQSNIENDKEISLSIKTRKSLYEKIEKKILETHPYEVPQVFSYEISQGYSPYLKWIEVNTQNL